ncbi:MAG: hypothetical protein KGI26_05040 [Thaumarchaeota archaeon]|nr:hypothetical protein [Nitrososphaerota archaeon]
MNQDLGRIQSLRRVLEAVGQGSGVSRSIVVVMGKGGVPGRDTARLLLLGNPIRSAMAPLVEASGEEVSMLASLIVAAPKSSAPLVGRSAGAVARTLERWVEARENRALEQKVLRFRSLVTSAVLGAVTSMLATLGPLVGSLGFVGGEATGPGALVYGAAAMAAIGSGMLGAFMSGSRFYVNVAVCLAAFGLVWAAASPLGSVSAVGLWGVK